MNYQFDSIEDAINEVKNGRLIIVLDSKDREYEGDFIGAAAKVTPETVNFMLKYARGAFIATFMPPVPDSAPEPLRGPTTSRRRPEATNKNPVSWCGPLQLGGTKRPFPLCHLDAVSKR